MYMDYNLHLLLLCRARYPPIPNSSAYVLPTRHRQQFRYSYHHLQMFNNNSVSISISDEDLEDFVGARVRPRVRRKRKKSAALRSNHDIVRRLVWKLFKWWPVLLLLPVVGLLLFEASKIIGRSPSGDGIRVRVHKDTEKRLPPANLNRLDATFHVVGSVKERGCLKILPPEELEHLVMPRENGKASPVKKLEYIKDGSYPYSGENSTSKSGDAGRFNLFTGYQTFSQRQKSFELSASATGMVHCGFFSEKGGFKISENDKQYMESCKVVVSTCAFGGGDDLYQPIGMSDATLQKVCYVAFWDEITLLTQKAQEQRVGQDGYIGKWRIVTVKELPFVDQRLNGKIPKMLAHRLFPKARFSIWVDSKSQFRRDPLGVIEALLWRSNSVLAISEHGARGSVYDEAKAVVKKNKATPEEVEVQITQYREDGLPEDRRFNGKKALNEASIIVREHTALTNLLMCTWFNEVVRFTSRDQLSFPYVLWRLKVHKDINMFPVCTRKDLVNSMGHVRKAKPLDKFARSF